MVENYISYKIEITTTLLKEITHYESKKSFITVVTGLILTISILGWTHIIYIDNNNSNDYSVGILSDDDMPNINEIK